MTSDVQAAGGQADIGVIGLAVMGENLILNMESRGFTVAAFNRTVSKVTAFTGVAPGVSASWARTACLNLRGAAQAAAPRDADGQGGRRRGRVHRAPDAAAVRGDIIIDGEQPPGGLHAPHPRTGREGLLFIGTGVSGGEEGALTGPSIMPGGNEQAWEAVKPIFQGIAARVADGTPCCDWVGPDGAGHFVKMVHNGIEYADMQMIAESYQLLRAAGLSAPEAGRSSPAGTRANWTAT